LAIVKRILEDHGGRLSLGDARPGPGARVVLAFPTAGDSGRAKAVGPEFEVQA
jgi:two-component system nitrogen regulation sensor histidine kinase NtrY